MFAALRVISLQAWCTAAGRQTPTCRDLKPENFLLSDKAETSPLKATDFGLSVFYKPGQTFTDVVGSAYYVAPEVRPYLRPCTLPVCKMCWTTRCPVEQCHGCAVHIMAFLLLVAWTQPTCDAGAAEKVWSGSRPVELRGHAVHPAQVGVPGWPACFMLQQLTASS